MRRLVRILLLALTPVGCVGLGGSGDSTGSLQTRVGEGPRGYVELSCPDATDFRVNHFAQGPRSTAERRTFGDWIGGFPIRKGEIQRFELPPGTASFGVRPPSPLLDEPPSPDPTKARLALEHLPDPGAWPRFEVLVVEDMVTPIVVRRGPAGIDVEVGALRPR